MNQPEMTDKIRTVLAEHGRLSVGADELRDDDDLYAFDMASHASVSVMLAVEEAFDVEFPEHMLRKITFSSIGAIRSALDELLASTAVDGRASGDA